ncbi:MAG: VWA domain-containing protein [Ardenticatenales bacterium]
MPNTRPDIGHRHSRAASSAPAARRALLAAIALGGLAALAAAPGAAPRRAAVQAQSIGNWGLAATSHLPPLPMAPIDLALDRAGNVLVVDGDNRAVTVFRPGEIEPSAWWQAPEELDALTPRPDLPSVRLPFAVAADPRPTDGRRYVLWAEIFLASDSLGEGVTVFYLESRLADGRRESVVRVQTFEPARGDLGVAVDLAVNGRTGEVDATIGGVALRIDRTTGATQRLAKIGRDGQLTRFAVAPNGDLVTASPWVGLVVRFNMLGTVTRSYDLGAVGYVPLDVAVDASDTVYALVRPASGAGADPALLVTFDAAGRPSVLWTARAVGAPAPEGDWPYALAMADGGPAGGWAATTASLAPGGRLRVQGRAAGGGPRAAIVGASAKPAWAPRLGGEAWGAGIALAAEDGDGQGRGTIAALDLRADRVVAFDTAGAMIGTRGVPSDTLDIALDQDGTLFLTTDDGAVERRGAVVGETGLRDMPPQWRVPLDLALGGRLTAGARLAVTRPRGREAAVLDVLNGATLGRIHVADSQRLWPTDIAAVSPGVAFPAGLFVTADLVGAQAQGWNPIAPGPLRGEWAMGLLAGPRRLAAQTVTISRSAADPFGSLATTTYVAGLLADGAVEVHEIGDGSDVVVAHFAPRMADGGVLSADDIALDPNGTVWLSDRRRASVHRFAPGFATPDAPAWTPGPSPTPVATPTLSAGACAVAGGKVAGPPRIVLGATARVTLTLSAVCPPRARVTGADVVLAIDRSGSMAGAKLAAAQSAARTFAELLDVRFHRLGLVAFDTTANVVAPLSSDVVPTIDGLAGLAPTGSTNLAAAVDVAAAHLAAAGRPEALPVVVLLTDGRQNGPGDPLQAADAARQAGVQLYTIGLGGDVNRPTLISIAGRQERFFDAPTPEDLFPVYGEILRSVTSSLAGNLVIDDWFSGDVAYVPGSAWPAAVEVDGALRWGRTLLPESGITMTYEVRPLRVGRVATNWRAVAEYADGDGARRTFTFPVPEIDVIAPTPTPTPTATPLPRPAYLPAMYRDACLPGARRNDVVVLIDTSGSMAGPKLDSAKAAARTFIHLVAAAGDQAAVVGFNDEPVLAAGLTRDTDVLVAAVDGLGSAPGTRIDRAMRAAAGELAGSPNRFPGSRGVVVLLSDGTQNGPIEAVYDVAAALKTSGALVFAIGLGADADAALLGQIASPGSYRAAADGGVLEAIYRGLAATVACR